MTRAWVLCLALVSLATAAIDVKAGQPSPVVEAGEARFTVISPTLLRLEYDAERRFVDQPSWFAVDRQAGELEYELEWGAGGALDLDTGRMHLVWRPDGQPFHAGNLRVELTWDGGDTTWRPGDEPEANLGGTLRSLDAVKYPLDLGRGLIARDGWALVDDSTGPVEEGAWYADRPLGSGLDWYLFGYGDEYRTAFRDLAAIAGPVPMPRRYLLGSWYSRWAKLPSHQFRAIVDEYDQKGFPLDVLVMDMHWHRDGWGGWSWNRDLLPDAEALLGELDQRELAVTLNLHPGDGVGPHEDRYAAFMLALGQNPLSGETVPFDAGDRSYLDALYHEVQVPLEQDGVDFWWLDWSRQRFTRSVKSLSNEAALARFTFEQTSRDGLRGTNFSRWAGWGDHRHPVHFSGDAYALFETLAFQVPFTSTAGNVGCFFWSHDIGGFRGDFQSPHYPELFARWVQFGAVSPALRLHSYQDKRPWLYPEPAAESMRRSFELRARLFPYVYSSVAQSCRETWPLVRPMYLEYPDDERAYRRPLQVLFGDHLLVAPITRRGTGPGSVAWRPVWFPAGRWYHLFTGERHDGDVEVLVGADLDEFPLYARGGVPIPMQPVTQRMASAPLAELVVRCWPGADGSTGRTTLYEDDGVSREYEQGMQALTELGCTREGNRTTVTLAATQGSYAGQPGERSLVVELPATANPTAATLDGVPVAFAWDAASRTSSVRVESRSIRLPVTVAVWAEEADQAAIRDEALRRRMLGVLGEEPASWREALERPDLSTESRNALLALGGYGLALLNESPTLHGGPEHIYAYAPESVPVSVRTFRRSSWQRQDEVVSEQSFASPRFPLRLEVEIPAKGPASAMEGLGEQRARGVAATFAHVGEARLAFETAPDTISRWEVTGPWPYDLASSLAEQSFAPEREFVDPASPESQSMLRPWRSLAADGSGVLDLEAVSPDDARIAYALVRLRSDRAQEATLWIASDDGAVMWVNGAEVYSHPEFRALTDAEPVPVIFGSGVNTILVKVGQHTGGWELRLGVVGQRPLLPEPPSSAQPQAGE